jgi:F0F1-type ATP synthase assembly protein I
MATRQPDDGDARERTKYAQAISLGITLAVGVGLFSFLGYYIDQKRGTGMFWTLCGVVTGLAYGAYEVWRVTRLLDTPGNNGQNNSHQIPKGKGPSEARKPSKVSEK